MDTGCAHWKGPAQEVSTQLSATALVPPLVTATQAPNSRASSVLQSRTDGAQLTPVIDSCTNYVLTSIRAACANSFFLTRSCAPLRSAMRMVSRVDGWEAFWGCS